MILFSLICLVLLAIALAFILPTLRQPAGAQIDSDEQARKEANIAVYQDQIGELQNDLQNNLISEEQYNQDRDALERRLLEDVSRENETAKPGTLISARGLVYGFALGLPIAAVALYFALGNPKALSAANLTPMRGSRSAQSESAGAMMNGMNGQPTQQQIEANVAALAKRLEQNPDDLQGWTMLARSYTSMERFAEANAAFAKATALKADDPNLWADYAFAEAMTNDRSLMGQPLVFINKALQLDPDNAKALQLAGSAASEAKNYKQAIEYWQRLLQKTPPDSELGRALTERIMEARKLANGSK
jgi:cytochrome c-type biogenesis protein CcmH